MAAIIASRFGPNQARRSVVNPSHRKGAKPVATVCAIPAGPPAPSGFAVPGGDAKQQLVQALLSAKAKSGLSFSDIAAKTGLSNVYVAQVFFNQSQLAPQFADKLKEAVPALTPELLQAVQKSPSRRFDPTLIQEPSIYRLYEAIMHGGEAIKAIINEECGDGIMSAIDFYANIETVEGLQGEKRVVITLNGKYLPFVAQAAEYDVTRRPPQ